jgi:hypothetical protein
MSLEDPEGAPITRQSFIHPTHPLQDHGALHLQKTPIETAQLTPSLLDLIEGLTGSP